MVLKKNIHNFLEKQLTYSLRDLGGMVEGRQEMRTPGAQMDGSAVLKPRNTHANFEVNC